MKKIILLLIAFMIMGSMCYAVDDSSEESVKKINLLLNQNKQLDDQLVYQIGNLASEISTNEQMFLVNQYEKNPWGPFALNFFIGLGMGSFVQGNSTAGWIEFGLELGGVILATGDKVGIVGGIGFISIIAGRTIGVISPFTYANKYNDTLKNALYGGELSVVPKIDQKGNMGIELAFSIPLK